MAHSHLLAFWYLLLFGLYVLLMRCLQYCWYSIKEYVIILDEKAAGGWLARKSVECEAILHDARFDGFISDKIVTIL